jgi:hypothetical protein
MPNVLKSGSLNLLEPSGPVQACNGIALPLHTASSILCKVKHKFHYCITRIFFFQTLSVTRTTANFITCNNIEFHIQLTCMVWLHTKFDTTSSNSYYRTCVTPYNQVTVCPPSPARPYFTSPELWNNMAVNCTCLQGSQFPALKYFSSFYSQVSLRMWNRHKFGLSCFNELEWVFSPHNCKWLQLITMFE